MSFGDKRIDRAYDEWKTQSPEDYFDYEEDDEDQDLNEKEVTQ